MKAFVLTLLLAAALSSARRVGDRAETAFLLLSPSPSRREKALTSRRMIDWEYFKTFGRKKTRREIFWDEMKKSIPKFKKLPRIQEYVKYASGQYGSMVPVVAPFHEPSTEFVPGLTAQPWWDPSQFPWISKLEENVETIQEELETALKNPGEFSFASDSAYSTTMGSGWSSIRLQRFGEWREENTAKFPKTTALLRDLNVPFAPRGVMFARQVPQTGVGRHSDGLNFILTLHLGLRVPKDLCSMKVGEEEWKKWEDGKSLVLDTSFVHETRNESPDSDRLVLIVDFWHPELTDEEREALQFVYFRGNQYDRKLIEGLQQPGGAVPQGSTARR
uniref:Aspartyl/asparaginy/proline hydroxylase domain-containing protein n=1 Tax=Chromera velia CCMP2878 TaxID=1169474 RepID=A0A0G4IEP4_9ALVE|eukprot:Cvel_13713.t1-p1 / transcript=Cvel_13713.t1 / gene=Cvel_13713 / organism=Chromera_velia_CCMP2878 / gene_product=Aspartyl/asparaginyl beta-hydroxylase, putative / transcript_product=Aspartyl/asparaginyl beta-hydroxylase, putative / location=Cvel_scaffold948:15866-18534(-) / protein_length=332 / sequence_SO=supercontig / SO=protein_coding / is_pseudo=false